MLLRNYLRLFRQAIEKLENHGYKVSYDYQYHDRNGELIFRYDNAVHRPALAFKNHKHTKDSAIVEATLPDISEIEKPLSPPCPSGESLGSFFPLDKWSCFLFY